MGRWLTAGLLVVGVAFMFVASLGVLRFGDLWVRIHAPTKAATLGLFALVAGVLVAVPDVRLAQALLAAMFVGATIPISAHILLRAAHRAGVRPRGAITDEYHERRTDAGPGGEPPDAAGARGVPAEEPR